MKLPAFIEASDLYGRKVLRLFIPLICAVALIFLYLPFLNKLAPIAIQLFGEGIGSFVASLPVILLIAIAFAIMIPLGHRFERNYGIRCEHCTEPLTKNRAIVIASKHCPNCGKRVISES